MNRGCGLKKALLLLNLLLCPLAFAGQQVVGNLSVSGNVGVGTTSNNTIALPLDVQGTARMTNLTVTSISGTQCLHAISGVVSGTGSDCGSGGGGGSGNVGIGTVNRIAQYIGTTTIGSPTNDTIDSNGNIGVGVTTPLYNLHVQQDQNAQTILALLNANSGAGATSTILTGQDPNNNYFVLRANSAGGANNSLSTILSSGAWVTGPSYTGGMVLDTSANAPLILATGGLTMGTTGVGGNERLRILGTGNIGIGSSNPGKDLDVGGTVRAIAFIKRGGVSTDFLKGDGSSDSSTYLTANQTITLTGDVTGSGSTAITTTLKNTGTAGTYRSTTFDANGRETSGTNPTTFSGYAISDTSANLAAALTDEVGTGFSVFNASPNFTGNVGIGSTNAGQTLDVNGTVRMTGFTLTGQGASSGNVMVSNAVGIGTWMAASTLPISGGSGTVNSGTTGQVGYYASSTTAISGSSAITVTGASSGNNVGIGSATPGFILDVQGTTRMLGINIGTSATGNYLDVEGTVNPVVFFGISSGSTAKNVGIGTFTPGQMLDVAGAGRFLGTGNTQLNPTAGNVGIGTSLSLNKLDVAGGVSIGTTNAGYQTAPSNGLIVQGNIGIGSTNPQSGLTLGTNLHLGSTGTAPTVASNDCGSTGQGTITAGSTDLRGSVVVGTLTVTSCAVTFNVAFGRAPTCITQDDTNILGTKNTQTTTKLTITSTTSMSSDTVTWVCIE